MAMRDRKSAITLTVFASLIWGTSFPGTKWGLDFVPNEVFFVWLRFVVAIALTLSIVLYFRRLKLSIFKNPVIWAIGGFNAAGFLLQYIGLTLTTSSKTALLVDINVVAVAIVSYFYFRERLGRAQIMGIFLGSVGVFLLTLNRELRFDPEEIVGDVLVYVAGWCWAFFIIFNKKMLDKHDGVEVGSAAIVTCAAWLTLPTAYLAATGADLSIEGPGWLLIVYLGLFCTFAATLLWASGLEGVTATASATIMLVEVLTALAISILLLKETMSPAAVVGCVVVLASIYLVAGTGLGEKEPVKAV
jgi:drug/metabolite transporter (DMT)-like permease